MGKDNWLYFPHVTPGYGALTVVSYWALVSLAVHVEIYRLFPSLVSHFSFSDSLYTTVKHTLRFTF